MYHFMSSEAAARKWIWRLVVICACVNATCIIFPHSITLGNNNPDLYDLIVSDPCIDSASCRYSTTAATVPAVWALHYYDCLRGASQHLPKRELKMNLSLPVICNSFDATATDTLTPHFPVYRVSRRRRPRPESMRCVLLLWAAFVCDGACPTLDDAAGLPPTEAPASPSPHPTRRYLFCRRYPLQEQPETLVYL